MTENNTILVRNTVTGVTESVPAVWLDLFPALEPVVAETEAAPKTSKENEKGGTK